MRRVAAVLLAALMPLAAGCEGGDSSSTRITSDTLTIYTGLPLRGERGADGRAVLRGQKLALDEVGGRVGDLSIGLVALDDTKTATGRWDPGQVAANAREAAENPSTIAYIGDLDSGATAVSLPISNEIAVLHVSPLSGYTGLTQPAVDKGEPAKYYPSGKRNFARLVPTGRREAQALAGWIAQLGFARVTIAYDGLQEGLGQGTELERALQAKAIEVVDVVRVDSREEVPDVAGPARDIARDPAPVLVYAGAATPQAVALLQAVHARAPAKALFATSGIARGALAAALPTAAGRLHMISPLLPLAQRPPAARRMAARHREQFGSAPPPAALYGYEAMHGVLDAIRAAGPDGNDRQAVIDAFFGRTAGSSVLGAYAIDADGDVSGAGFGAFGVRDGRPRFERLLPAPAG